MAVMDMASQDVTSIDATQADREQIYKLVMHGEELLSRFRHWEPIISEFHVASPRHGSL